MLAGIVSTPEYRDWQWDIVQRLRTGLELVYETQPDELECIRALLSGVGSTAPFRSHHAPDISLAVESAYLHGHRSQVKFTVGGVEHQRELADVLALGSFVENGTLKWQRACLIQAKREHPPVKRRAARFDIDEWQLSLLRTFPQFTGVTGLFDGLSCKIRNHSGMLGAYGLLSAPGEICVVSAKILHLVLAGRKSFSPKDLLPAMLSEANDRPVERNITVVPWWPFDPEHCPVCHDLFEQYWPFPLRKLWAHHRHRLHSHHNLGTRCDQPIASRLTCLGLEEFINAWSSLRLGEIWYPTSAAKSDRALRDLVLKLVYRTDVATGDLQHIKRLVASCGEVPTENQAMDDRPWNRNDGGLIILSAVAMAEKGEG